MRESSARNVVRSKSHSVATCGRRSARRPPTSRIRRVLQGTRRGQDRELDRTVGQLLRSQTGKPRILEGGAQGKTGDGTREVALRRQRSDAAPQPFSDSKRDEERAGVAERLGAVREETRRRLPAEVGLQSAAREREELPPRLLRKRSIPGSHGLDPLPISFKNAVSALSSSSNLPSRKWSAPGTSTIRAEAPTHWRSISGGP